VHTGLPAGYVALPLAPVSALLPSSASAVEAVLSAVSPLVAETQALVAAMVRGTHANACTDGHPTGRRLLVAVTPQLNTLRVTPLPAGAGAGGTGASPRGEVVEVPLPLVDAVRITPAAQPPDAFTGVNSTGPSGAASRGGEAQYVTVYVCGVAAAALQLQFADARHASDWVRGLAACRDLAPGVR